LANSVTVERRSGTTTKLSTSSSPSTAPHHELIDTHVLAWLECGFVLEEHSQQQLEQLDRLIERWSKN
jgi:hypothetical protein